MTRRWTRPLEWAIKSVFNNSDTNASIAPFLIIVWSRLFDDTKEDLPEFVLSTSLLFYVIVNQTF